MADLERKLQTYEKRFEKGDKNALADALFLVLANRLELPEWLRWAWVKAFANVVKGRVKSWDDELGYRHKGKHLPDVKRRAELCFPVWEAGQILRRKKGIAVGPALWEHLAGDFNIGERLARELYYRVERLGNRTRD